MLTASLLINFVLPPLAILKSEYIYETAPLPSCHASTIVETTPGCLAAAWFGGTAEGKPDVCIYISRCGPDGEWAKPAKVADGAGYACYNPVLFQPSHGPLLLFYKVGPNPAHWWGMLKTSRDGGRHWSKESRLPEGILGPIKNKPIELAGGTILCPSSSEANGWTIHMESTRDFGKTWTTTGPLNDPKKIEAIQPAILRRSDGPLRLIGRTKQGAIFAVDSRAEPGTEYAWGEVMLTLLPNPNSGIDAVSLRNGRHLLVYNPTTKGRTPLVVAISEETVTWRDVVTLEDGPGEFSYPAIIQTADGLVHITYTWQRKRIKHVVLDPNLLYPLQYVEVEDAPTFRARRP